MKNYSVIFQKVNYFATEGVFRLIASKKKKAIKSFGGFCVIDASDCVARLLCYALRYCYRPGRGAVGSLTKDARLRLNGLFSLMSVENYLKSNPECTSCDLSGSLPVYKISGWLSDPIPGFTILTGQQTVGFAIMPKFFPLGVPMQFPPQPPRYKS
ncbi:hypothetical protein Runsl_5152 [Runella slithyformis DSM 19594]|uniref:Uncharacterized protein n=1 Tax=Runella slithyformis (strain ATCC 29530 / DSM 19594 / LMG 11500 / NCIMB 11436 / LSU 4) TaxID=761193 RepID=A0A7U3ZQE3_RUNSL|nr:hypothetical protein Runsl_5152 [Runella slithyformis DSM 19594]